MNNKDLKKLLKSSLDTQVPNISARIDLQSIEILDAPEKRIRFSLKPIITTATLALTTLLLVFVWVQFIRPEANPIETPMTLTAESTYSFSALSSSVLLEAVELQLSNAQQMVLLSAMTQETKIKQRIGTLNPYFNMIEIFMSNQDLNFSEPTASNLEGYAYQVTYQTIDLNGDAITYQFHYNLVKELETDFIDGVLILGEKQFYLEGSKITYDKGVTIRTKTYSDITMKDQNYIEVMSHELNRVQWFEYKVYHQGQNIEKTTVYLETVQALMRVRLTYENESQDLKVVLQANRIDTALGARLRVQYDYSDDRYHEKGTIVVTVRINDLTGKTQYHYAITNAKGEKDEYAGIRGNSHSGKS